MATYKLACGYEFALKPCGIGDESADLLAFVMDMRREDAPTPKNDAENMEWGRRGVVAVLKASAPEALKRATLADVMRMSGQLVDMINDAWGEPIAAPEADSKNA